MATFQVNKNKNSGKKNIKKIVGWSILVTSTLVFLFSVTSLIPALQYFFLGILGIFVYPLSVLGIIISLALLNNKKYVMPKRYAIFLTLSLYLFLSIIQLIILGSPYGLSYGEFLALNYTKQITAGGMIIGFLPSTFAYLMGLPATYVILSLGLVASIAFFVEAVLSLRKTNSQTKPIKLQIKEREEKVVENPRGKSRHYSQLRQSQEDENQSQEYNVMLDGNREEEKKRELSAREKLGLIGKGYNNYSNSYNQNNSYSGATKYNFSHDIKLPEEEKKSKVPEGMSVKEYLLTPPTVDMAKFMEHKPKPSQQTVQNQSSLGSFTSSMPNASTSEINKNISSLKSKDEIKPSSFVHEESYDLSQSQTIKRGNLPDVRPEEITSEAEDIIRSVVEQEKIDRNIDEQNFPSNNLSERNSSSTSDYNDYIDFGEVENTSNDSIQSRDSLARGESFDRTLSRNGEGLDRENLSRNNDLTRRENGFERGETVLSQRKENYVNNDLTRKENFDQDDNSYEESSTESDMVTNSSQETYLSGSDRSLNDRKQTFDKPKQDKPIDEMERRKRFVQLDDEKPPEKIKPYKYTRPPIDLITTKSDDLSVINEEVPLKRVALENALENFGVPAKVQNVVIGPTITRYEIEMPEGISVKRILSLDADIAYALSANGQIRIEAPIPGRSIVGIEVPNSKVAKVSIKDVLQSKEFALSPSPLTFALGKDITGNVKVCNLQKMPHLLVAGTTGSGKSVCLNSIIVSILYKASPDEVKFIMIDPKQVELSMYEGLPHMVVPRVITDPTKAVNALQWAVDEMERRFKLISEERVRNIGEYNKLDKVVQNKVKKMPYLVIIFDEFADFMAVAKNEIEDKIRRIAQKARAAGIHLILATQRPSTDVVTGTLKGNLPARIAFKVASRVDSEVILGSTGAEKLLGYGDMLYKPSDAEPSRLQGCFIDTPETKDIVNFIIEHNEEIYDEEANNAINNPNKANNNGSDSNGVDPLLPQALKLCIDNGVASTTMVQRKLSIGYPRAARIVDQMEERGYISSAEGSKQRQVYVTIDEFYSIFGDIYD